MGAVHIGYFSTQTDFCKKKNKGVRQNRALPSPNFAGRRAHASGSLWNLPYWKNKQNHSYRWFPPPPKKHPQYEFFFPVVLLHWFLDVSQGPPRNPIPCNVKNKEILKTRKNQGSENYHFYGHRTQGLVDGGCSNGGVSQFQMTLQNSEKN